MHGSRKRKRRTKMYNKLLAVQTELKAPKGQYNSFGKYKYRSCEDILEAVKPILAKHKATLYITDEIKLIGERYYVEATAHFVDIDSGKEITTKAYAREEESKKGMDGSQVTGASSSYARKYALNGLFDIDDTKDSDATNTHGKELTPTKKELTPTKKELTPTKKELTPRQKLLARLRALGMDANTYGKQHNITSKTTDAEFEKLLADLCIKKEV